MPTHFEKRFLAFTPQQMFDLVIDVDKYPEFLPWCIATRINSKTEGSGQDQGGVGEMSADMAIGFKAFRESYTSHITFERPSADRAGHINVVDSHGPFKRLVTDWRFVPAEGGVNVEFEIDFEFKSRLLEGMIGKMFEKATRMMINAFKTRAEKLYGP